MENDKEEVLLEIIDELDILDEGNLCTIKFSDDIRALIKSYKESENQIEYLEGELEDAESEIDDLNGEIFDKDQEINNLNDEIYDLNDEIDNKENEISDLGDEIAYLKMVIDSLESDR